MNFWLLILLSFGFTVAASGDSVHSVAAAVFFVGAVILEKMDDIEEAIKRKEAGND